MVRGRFLKLGAAVAVALVVFAVLWEATKAEPATAVAAIVEAADGGDLDGDLDPPTSHPRPHDLPADAIATKPTSVAAVSKASTGTAVGSVAVCQMPNERSAADVCRLSRKPSSGTLAF